MHLIKDHNDREHCHGIEEDNVMEKAHGRKKRNTSNLRNEKDHGRENEKSLSLNKRHDDESGSDTEEDRRLE